MRRFPSKSGNALLIRVGYEIAFSFPQPTAMAVLLYVHPSRASTIRIPERFEVEPRVRVSEFVDSFGNRCGRLFVPAGRVVLGSDATVEDSGQPDPQVWNAPQHNVDGKASAAVAIPRTHVTITN